MKININDVVNDSIVDGVGLRYTIFVQGCHRHCDGCHNPQTHDPDDRHLVEVESLIEQAKKNPLIDGITISGGEPMEQAPAVFELAKRAKQEGLTVWLYTGYHFSKLLDFDIVRRNLKYIDVVVDGPFIKELQSYEARFRGSTNQCIIDVQRSLEKGDTVLWEG